MLLIYSIQLGHGQYFVCIFSVEQLASLPDSLSRPLDECLLCSEEVDMLLTQLALWVFGDPNSDDSEDEDEDDVYGFDVDTYF